MNQEILFNMPSPFRDDFKIRGFRFGSGKPTLAIVGAMRGDEIQQQFICSQMVKILKKLEEEGNILPDNEILVVPNSNHFSMNIEKRFWAMDNTDINRMFPGYDKGETTQRIAAALFEKIKHYAYGIQLASFYIPGNFIPHIRMMRTGYQAEQEATQFGLQYVFTKNPHPYDTTILNYNWQVWGAKAFSLYAGTNYNISEGSTNEACRAILRFMASAGIIKQHVRAGYRSTIITDGDLTSVKAEDAGIFYKLKDARSEVRQGETLAHILDPYDGSILHEVTSPATGTIFFAHDKPLSLQGTLLYKIIGE
jgi:predicted deacylase